jgi:hypothetical protein
MCSRSPACLQYGPNFQNGTRNRHNRTYRLSIKLLAYNYLSVNTMYLPYVLSVNTMYSLCVIMSHGPGRIQQQLLQILRSRRIAVDTAELARLVYLERELTPAQRVAAWRALDGLEARGLVIRRSRRGRCYWASITPR